MTPEISEFSYGFALTNEMIGWSDLQAAPVFPSLIAEGQTGGGYDVKLDIPGVPVFLQFKRSDCITRGSGKEIKKFGASLDLPYYRFHVTEKKKSNQHELLLQLDNSPNIVFYAAPMFYQIAEIDRAWLNGRVAAESMFVRPFDIGSLDDRSHCVAFDLHRRTFLCSEPKTIASYTATEVVGQLTSRLKEDARPLRDKVEDIAVDMAAAARRAAQVIRERAQTVQRDQTRSPEPSSDSRAKRAETISSAQAFDEIASRVSATPSDREVFSGAPSAPAAAPRQLSRPEETDPIRAELKKSADFAARFFNAQLVIVQPRD